MYFPRIVNKEHCALPTVSHQLANQCWFFSLLVTWNLVTLLRCYVSGHSTVKLLRIFFVINKHLVWRELNFASHSSPINVLPEEYTIAQMWWLMLFALVSWHCTVGKNYFMYVCMHGIFIITVRSCGFPFQPMGCNSSLSRFVLMCKLSYIWSPRDPSMRFCILLKSPH